MLNLALLGAGAVGSPLDFRCVTAQQEHFGRHQRAELFQPVLTNTSGPPACQTLQTTFQKALDRAYKNSRGSPKDKYHRILGKESWRAVGKEGYDHSLGMPRTMARIVESITFMVEEILANNVEGGVMETGVRLPASNRGLLGGSPYSLLKKGLVPPKVSFARRCTRRYSRASNRWLSRRHSRRTAYLTGISGSAIVSTACPELTLAITLIGEALFTN